MLTVSDLTKRFGGFTALNAVSFEVRQGEILLVFGGASTAPSDASPSNADCAGKAGARKRFFAR